MKCRKCVCFKRTCQEAGLTVHIDFARVQGVKYLRQFPVSVKLRIGSLAHDLLICFRKDDTFDRCKLFRY